MSNTLVFMMWLTLMSVQYGSHRLTPSQLIVVATLLVGAVICDTARLIRWWMRA